jgi:hypothetical protein
MANIPQLGDDVPEPILVAGETSDVGSEQLTHAAFVAKMYPDQE